MLIKHSGIRDLIQYIFVQDFKILESETWNTSWPQRMIPEQIEHNFFNLRGRTKLQFLVKRPIEYEFFPYRNLSEYAPCTMLLR